MNDQRGVAVLISVLIIGAAAATAAFGVLLFGLSSAGGARATQDGIESVSIADGCVERALLELWSNPTFVGSSNETIAGETCVYTVTDLLGGSKQIDASATVLTSTVLVRAVVAQINPTIEIDSWKVL